MLVDPPGRPVFDFGPVLSGNALGGNDYGPVVFDVRAPVSLPADWAPVRLASGRPDKAAPHYAALAELWSEADPPFRARAESAVKRLAALGIEWPRTAPEVKVYLDEGRMGFDPVLD